MRRSDPTTVARLHALVGAVEAGGPRWAPPADAPTLRLVAVRDPVLDAPEVDVAAAAAPEADLAAGAPPPAGVAAATAPPAGVAAADLVPAEVVPPEPPAAQQHPAAAPNPSDAPPSLVWAPPTGLREALAASVRSRVPAPLRSGRWDPGRRGAYLVGVLGLLAAGVATVVAVHGRAQPAPAAVPVPVESSGAPPADDLLAGPTLQVDVEGRVRRPGVVTVPAGGRVAQALAAAGGALPGTDTSALDLAQKVTDGQQLRVGVSSPAVAPAAGSADTDVPAPGGPTALVDLNTATADQLDALPHIGPATAAKVIAWRTAHGPFTAVSQLQQVSGIGPSTYQDIAPLVDGVREALRGRPGDGPRPDLRLLVPAGGCWLAVAVLGGRTPRTQLVGAALAAAVAVLVLLRPLVGRPASAPTGLLVATGLLAVCAGLVSSGVRAQARSSGPLPVLASAHADVVLRLQLSGDPVLRTGVSASGHPYRLVIADAQAVRVETDDGRAWSLRRPVLVLADDDAWLGLLPSQTLTAAGLLAPPRPGDAVAAVLDARGPPERIGPASAVQRVAGSVRARLRASSAGLPGQAAALLPALVDGDTSGLSPATSAEFRTTGLTHLVAVSGENLAIVTGVVLGAVRRLRLGPRPAALVTALTIGGFVVLARPSPSVLRAAVMGGIALTSLAAGRRRPALGGLAAAVLILVLADPALAPQAGFTLSVLASLGLLVLAPGLTDRLAAYLPRPLATALAVPTAAQLACTPVIAAIGGGLGLLAIPANLLAAPAVAPATVLGVLAAVVGPVLPGAGHLLAALGWLPCRWLVLVAHVGARVPLATVALPSGRAGAAVAGAAAGLVTMLPTLLHRVRPPPRRGILQA